MAELKLAELKLAEQKFGGDPRPLGGGDPSASAKRSVEQKMAEQKNWWGPSAIGWRGPLVQVQKGQWNKKWRNKNLVGILGHYMSGTTSTSAERSAEQKMVELVNWQN